MINKDMITSKILNKGTLLADNSENIVIKEGKSFLEDNGLSKDDIDYYAERLVAVMDDYAAKFGEGKEFEYRLGKRFGRLELIMSIPGEKMDPFETGEESGRRKLEKALALNLHSQVSCIKYSYIMGCNIVSGQVPIEKKKKSMLKDATLWAVILGVAVGLICLHLPENANQFIMENLMDPINSLLLKVISGIMGPVIFISLVTSIISLDSVNELTNLGLKIFRRCFRSIMFFTVLSLLVSMLFFENFGPDGIDFSAGQIISLLLSIVPDNLVSPFVENNTPQIVIIAFVSGIALLILGDNSRELKDILHQCNDWIMTMMELVYTIIPAVPFFSIATAIGNGEIEVIKKGWKFIAASYIIFTIGLLFKMIKTQIVTKVSAIEVLRKTKDILITSFVTSSTTASLSRIYEASEKDLHIKPEFTSFWIPMASAMMALKTTVNVVVATVMMADFVGSQVSLSFMLVLIIMTVELSLASPGTVGSWVIAFQAFSMPTSYVGLFSTYRVLTVNYATAVVTAYSLFEELEAAYALDQIDDSMPERMDLSSDSCSAVNG